MSPLLTVQLEAERLRRLEASERISGNALLMAAERLEHAVERSNDTLTTSLAKILDALQVVNLTAELENLDYEPLLAAVAQAADAARQLDDLLVVRK